jgi:hypothetical protein
MVTALGRMLSLPAGVGLQASMVVGQLWPTTIHRFPIFTEIISENSFKVPKFKENAIKLKQKQQISLDSFLGDLCNRLDQISFCALLPYRKLL